MADATTNLGLPFIMPSQAQKHVTHNDALLLLDAISHLAVEAELSEPPASPAEGARYLVGASPSGAWSGKAGVLAARQDGAWHFIAPREGWIAWFVDQDRIRVYSAGIWRDGLPEIASFQELGIGATPDATNRLAVSAAASLFNHAGAGHQIKVNKADVGDTASLLFQSGWTGYAEMGLAGDNSFSVKVSDGMTWKTAIAISGTGRVSRPSQPAARAHRAAGSFTPGDGQQSGFTTFGLNQGGFSLGTAVTGGGNRLTVPADGVYLVCLSIAVLSSSGHRTGLLLDGADTLLSMSGMTGGAQTQSASGIFSLNAGAALTLTHEGTAELELGPGKTELSLALL